MVLAAWSLTGAVLSSRHECALLKVGTHPDMTLDVPGMQNSNNQATNQLIPIHSPEGGLVMEIIYSAGDHADVQSVQC